MPAMPFLRESPKGATIDISVQPRASRSEVSGMHQGRLRLRLTSPPVEGEANRECVRLLSKMLNIPKSEIEIVQGLKSRSKTILLHGRKVKEIEVLLAPAVSASSSAP